MAAPMVSLASVGDDCRIISLAPDAEAVVGRASDLSVENRFESGKISGKHCRFYVKSGKLFVEDLSKNGTFVDGVNVTEAQPDLRQMELADGATVMLTNPKKVTDAALKVGFVVRYELTPVSVPVLAAAPDLTPTSVPVPAVAPVVEVVPVDPPPAQPEGGPVAAAKPTKPAKKKLADMSEEEEDVEDDSADASGIDDDDDDDDDDASAPTKDAGPKLPQEIHDLAFKGDLAKLKEVYAGVPQANVNACCQRGNTALYSAARWGHAEMVQWMLDTWAPKGLNVSAPNGVNKSTPLHGAAYGSHADVVKSLLARGANPTAKNKFGETPLDNAKKPAGGHKAETKQRCVRLLSSQPPAKKIRLQ